MKSTFALLKLEKVKTPIEYKITRGNWENVESSFQGQGIKNRIISKNQKQDLFESLYRSLVEKFICPNLIPQVGLIGGGDGKTNPDTHPISKFIPERWFISEIN